MNIAFFVVNLNSYSGASQQALLLAKNLQNDKKIYIFNIDNTIIENSFIEIKKNIYKIDIGTTSISQLYRMILLIKKYDIEILHLHVLNYFIIILGKLLQKRIVLKTTMLGADDFQSKLQSKFGKLKLFIIKCIDINVALTEKIKNKNSNYIEMDKIIKIPNGVEIPKNNDSKKKNYFVFIGLVCPRKSTLDSIKYFSNHYSNLSSSKLFIIGPNDVSYGIKEFDEAYYQECLKFVEDNNLKDKVVFTGLLSKKEIHANLKTAKALLFFSKKEGMPNVVIEAMSYNCLPITSNIDGAAVEMFYDKKNGFIISDLTTEISMATIDRILEQRLPYTHALEKFDIKNIAEKYNSLYNVLVNKKKDL